MYGNSVISIRFCHEPTTSLNEVKPVTAPPLPGIERWEISVEAHLLGIFTNGQAAVPWKPAGRPCAVSPLPHFL